MFQKIHKTGFPPAGKPVLVWDGHCGFCAYWVARWQKITGEKVEYKTFQETAEIFADIPLKEFKKASRLIDTQGFVYSGPRSAFRTLKIGGSGWKFLDDWYATRPWFEKLCDNTYNWIAKNRPFMFRLTKAMFGANPHQPRPFWVIYVGILVYFIYWVFLR